MQERGRVGMQRKRPAWALAGSAFKRRGSLDWQRTNRRNSGVPPPACCQEKRQRNGQKQQTCNVVQSNEDRVVT